MRDNERNDGDDDVDGDNIFGDDDNDDGDDDDDDDDDDAEGHDDFDCGWSPEWWRLRLCLSPQNRLSGPARIGDGSDNIGPRPFKTKMTPG